MSLEFYLLAECPMEPELSLQEVSDWIELLHDAIRHNPCWSCDILQGFLVQLEMDAEPGARERIEPLKVPREKMHRSAGCDPCQCGALHARYLREHPQ